MESTIYKNLKEIQKLVVNRVCIFIGRTYYESDLLIIFEITPDSIMLTIYDEVSDSPNIMEMDQIVLANETKIAKVLSAIEALKKTPVGDGFKDAFMDVLPINHVHRELREMIRSFGPYDFPKFRNDDDLIEFNSIFKDLKKSLGFSTDAPVENTIVRMNGMSAIIWEPSTNVY